VAVPITFQTPVASGITPGGALGAQLQAITRRSFLPYVYVQGYQAHPLLSLLFENARAAQGGVSQITVPAQGSQFTTFSWGSFAGDFPMPTDKAAIQNVQLNLKLGMVPVGFFGLEAIIQSSEVVVPKLRAVMSDAAVVMRQAYARSLFSNNSASPEQWDSMPACFDDGTNVDTYGGISRSTNPFWKGQLFTGVAGGTATRGDMATLLVQAQSGAGGEAPDFAVMHPFNWAVLMRDFVSVERYNTSPTTRYGEDDVVNGGFRAIRVLDTPVFPDPFCPIGEAYFINSRYFSLFLSEYAPLTFIGFESQVPVGQISEIGVLISASNLVCTKPSSGAHLTGLTLPTGTWPAPAF
jgi:hypothetical protein